MDCDVSVKLFMCASAASLFREHLLNMQHLMQWPERNSVLESVATHDCHKLNAVGVQAGISFNVV